MHCVNHIFSGNEIISNDTKSSKKFSCGGIIIAIKSQSLQKHMSMVYIQSQVSSMRHDPNLDTNNGINATELLCRGSSPSGKVGGEWSSHEFQRFLK